MCKFSLFALLQQAKSCIMCNTVRILNCLIELSLNQIFANKLLDLLKNLFVCVFFLIYFAALVLGGSFSLQ